MEPLFWVALGAAAMAGILASISLLRAPRREHPPDNPFGASTEGSRRCPRCGMGNLWTERTCSACGADLGD